MRAEEQKSRHGKQRSTVGFGSALSSYCVTLLGSFLSCTDCALGLEEGTSQRRTTKPFPASLAELASIPRFNSSLQSLGLIPRYFKTTWLTFRVFLHTDYILTQPCPC